MRSPFQQTVLVSISGVLLPLAKLMLRCGVGCSEFVAIAKAVFVQAASEEYGVRGRPTNVSRVAAMTGLSRKEVRRIRNEGSVARWTPDMEVTPANTVIHYWHFDPAFCHSPGSPKPLSFEGEHGFSALVRKYVGDIPPGAMRKELVRAGTVSEDEDHNLVVQERFFYPEAFDEDFVRNAAFALRNLGQTLLHNSALASRDSNATRNARFERFAWTDRLTPEGIQTFQSWVKSEGKSFIERADYCIGHNEVPIEVTRLEKPRAVGVGLYYFEED